MACPFSGVTVRLPKYPSTYDNFYLLYSGERENFSGRLQSFNNLMISSSYTLKSHTPRKHTITLATNKNSQRNVFPASGLLHHPFLAALISAHSAGLTLSFPAPRDLRVRHPADVVLAGPPLSAAAAAAPRTTISLRVLGPAVGSGGQVRRRAGVLGELAQRDAARDS